MLIRKQLSLSTPALLSLAAVVLIVVVPTGVVPAQTLYGVVSQGTNAGYLIQINVSTGAASPIGNTGLSSPGGLAYSSTSTALYAIDTFGGGQVYSVNPSTGAATALSSSGMVPIPGALAYRAADNSFYTSMPGLNASTLYQLNSSTGGISNTIGVINKGPIGGLAVRASDGVLFGAGTGNTTQDWLFTISTTPGPPPRETNVGQTNRMITGLAFHPNGTLYGSDGSNLVTINTSNANVAVVGPFGSSVGFVAGLEFVPGVSPGSPDVWIRDCASDTGNVPSYPAPCPQYWTSPDIWIDNNGDMIIDAPVVGANNSLKAAIRNRGNAAAQNVTVQFYYRDNTTGLVFPDGATLIGTDTVSVPANSGVVASTTWQNLPAPPSTGGHWCIGVVLNHPDDPAITPTVPPYQDNNVGLANLWFIAGRAGEQVTLSFNAGTGGETGFGLDPWPRDFVVKVEAELPRGWRWKLEGVEDGRPFALKLGEERPVQLVVDIPKDTKPHAGGWIDARQVDVKTGTVIGGVHYNLYEDHLPPEPVRILKVSVVDDVPVLTWEPVIREAKSGLRERVAYYEILRDGKPVAKAVSDADRHQPGMQWKDFGKGSTYAIRVVDDGGNTSEKSPDASASP